MKKRQAFLFGRRNYSINALYLDRAQITETGLSAKKRKYTADSARVHRNLCSFCVCLIAFERGSVRLIRMRSWKASRRYSFTNSHTISPAAWSRVSPLVRVQFRTSISEWNRRRHHGGHKKINSDGSAVIRIYISHISKLIADANATRSHCRTTQIGSHRRERCQFDSVIVCIFGDVCGIRASNDLLWLQPKTFACHFNCARCLGNPKMRMRFDDENRFSTLNDSCTLRIPSAISCDCALCRSDGVQRLMAPIWMRTILLAGSCAFSTFHLSTGKCWNAKHACSAVDAIRTKWIFHTRTRTHVSVARECSAFFVDAFFVLGKNCENNKFPFTTAVRRHFRLHTTVKIDKRMCRRVIRVSHNNIMDAGHSGGRNGKQNLKTNEDKSNKRVVGGSVDIFKWMDIWQWLQRHFFKMGIATRFRGFHVAIHLIIKRSANVIDWIKNEGQYMIVRVRASVLKGKIELHRNFDALQIESISFCLLLCCVSHRMSRHKLTATMNASRLPRSRPCKEWTNLHHTRFVREIRYNAWRPVTFTCFTVQVHINLSLSLSWFSVQFYFGIPTRRFLEHSVPFIID